MKTTSGRMAIRVALFYAVFAGLWILLSDRVLAALASTSEILTRWQTYKGWVFVIVTSVMLYLERVRSGAALSESEAKFRTLSETVACAILLYQDDGLFYINPMTERITGYSRGELLHKQVWDICHPEFKEMVKSHVQSRQLREMVPGRFEFKIITKNGEERWLDFTDGALEYSGRMAGFGSAFDITERKRAEEQITLALREKVVLLKEVHHRVKNNLQVITSLLNLQAQRAKNQEVLEMFLESKNRIKSMALIHEKLYRSADLARVDFGEYVRNLAENLLQSYDARKIALRIDIEGMYLGVDAAIPIGLIINELVSNSLKHGFVDGRPGEISIEMISTARDTYRLRVGDNGVGLPEDIAIPKTESLGLQLIVSLTEQLNGRMEVARNGGTSFVIEFETS